MGKRGAPIGNRNGAKGRKWTNAIEWALREYTSEETERKHALFKTIKRGQALRAIALRTVDDAVEGKEHAIREIAERIEGKVGTGDSGGPLRVLVMRNGPQGPEAVRMLEVQAQRIAAP